MGALLVLLPLALEQLLDSLLFPVTGLEPLLVGCFDFLFPQLLLDELRALPGLLLLQRVEGFEFIRDHGRLLSRQR